MSEKEKIESLNEKLYSRTRYDAPKDTREPLSEQGNSAPEKWESPNIDELLMAERRAPEAYPLMKKIFMVSLLFFVCAMAAAALIYFKGDNFISTRNLDIQVEGPVSISAGSPVDLAVTIINKNNASLSEVSLVMIYPEGTRNAENPTEPLSSLREELEALGPGERITRDERAIFLGSEGEVKTVRVSVTYKVEGSNATFTKDKQFELTIGSAPVNVSIVRPDSVSSGEPFTATINVSANSEESLRNIVLKAEYPYGWTLSSATPAASDAGKSLWRLGNLSPGDKKTVELRGALLGEDGDERTFRFFVGVGEAGAQGIETVLSSGSMDVSIDRPAIAMGLKLNGSESEQYSAPAGENIRAMLTVRNNLPEGIQNPALTVRLSGSALDRSSVSPQGGGFYNSAQNTIVWNSGNTQGFGTLAPGVEKTFIFDLASLDELGAGSSNQRIDIAAELAGRPQGGAAPVIVSASRVVRIASEVALSSRSLFSRGPYKNTGHIPPQAEKDTTYTIALTLGNTRNDISGAKVVGTLGPNVNWLGSEDGRIKYDIPSNTFTWNVGDLPSGAGFSAQAEEAFFRVLLTPSLGQVGGAPVLVSGITFTGTDTFTETEVRVTNPAVTTRISSDPEYVQGDEFVVK